VEETPVNRAIPLLKQLTWALVVVAGAVALPAEAAWAALPHGSARGFDISWPQCGGAYPASPSFGIVGVNGGRAFTQNPCLADEYRWARSAPTKPMFYANTGNPGTLSAHWGDPGPRPCSGGADDLGCAYNYGWNAAKHAFRYARAQTGRAGNHTWWLDVETTNSWSANQRANLADIQGMIDFLRSRSGVTVGIYSTSYQWGVITGGASFPSLPNWVAGARDAAEAASFCTPSKSFTGGPVTVVQFPSGGYDGDYAC
jgi:hypothetical protein